MSRHIFVVEDEKDSRKILRDLLSSAAYKMTEAENGEQALWRRWQNSGPI